MKTIPEFHKFMMEHLQNCEVDQFYDHYRRTGRTTRKCMRAVMEASAGNDVVFVIANGSMRNYVCSIIFGLIDGLGHLEYARMTRSTIEYFGSKIKVVTPAQLDKALYMHSGVLLIDHHQPKPITIPVGFEIKGAVDAP